MTRAQRRADTERIKCRNAGYVYHRSGQPLPLPPNLQENPERFIYRCRCKWCVDSKIRDLNAIREAERTERGRQQRNSGDD